MLRHDHHEQCWVRNSQIDEPFCAPRRYRRGAVKPDRDDLRNAVKHVCYEFQRAQSLPAALERARAAGDEPGVSACFESFFLHLRNLIEFLDRSKPSHISATNYTGNSWHLPKTESLTRLRRSERPMNAHISHLTWERVTVAQNYGNGDWEIANFARSLDEAFSAFIDSLDGIDAEAAEWFRARLRGDVTD